MSDEAECGVLYVATDDDILREAVLSAKSLREHNDVPITVVTDASTDYDVFDTEIILEDPDYNWLDKISGMKQSPYTRTLYLDTDIYVNAEITELFDWLDQFDVAALPQVCDNTNQIDDIPDSLNEYCMGVVPFGDGLSEFLDQWYENLNENLEEYHGDVAAFRQTLWETDVRIAPLPPEYNCKPRWAGVAHDEVKILHERLLDIDTMGARKRFESEKIINEINSVDGNRVHFPVGGFIRSTKGIKIFGLEKKEIIHQARLGENKANNSIIGAILISVRLLSLDTVFFEKCLQIKCQNILLPRVFSLLMESESIPSAIFNYIYWKFRGRFPRRIAVVNGEYPVYKPRLLDPFEKDVITDHEIPLINGIKKTVSPGDDVIIVGGGIGGSTLAASRSVGECGSVTTYEAGIEYSENLRKTVRVNQQSEIADIVHAAVGSPNAVRGKVGEEIPRVSPTDVPECDVLILDCEGAEYEILDDLKIDPNSIVVEYHGIFDVPEEDVRELLDHLGYEVIQHEMEVPDENVGILTCNRQS